MPASSYLETLKAKAREERVREDHERRHEQTARRQSLRDWKKQKKREEKRARREERARRKTEEEAKKQARQEAREEAKARKELQEAERRRAEEAEASPLTTLALSGERPDLPPELLEELDRRLVQVQREITYKATVENNRWIKQVPTEKQKEFLLLSDKKEILYGGAVGGAKSSALLMAALQFVDVPTYSAIIFRKTYANLSKPGALMDRAREWLANTGAHWKEQDHVWRFPSGATLAFGFMDKPNDRFNYNSAEFQYAGFDELCEFEEQDYRYLFSRLRRGTADSLLPIRMRTASNPGGPGHQWVYERFFERGPAEGRIYIPAKLDDNPHIDKEEYIKTLSEVDPITLEQLLNGDWTARHSGSMFKREWFQIVEDSPDPRDVAQCVRVWDLAATEPKKGKELDPDFTTGAKMCRTTDGVFWILDMIRRREDPGTIEQIIYETAKLDGQSVPIVIERETGASGKFLAEHFLKLLAGWTFFSSPVGKSGGKVARATPLACQAYGGKVKVLRRLWTQKFLDELEGFPITRFDDQVDACGYGLRYITDNCSYTYGIEGVNSHKQRQIWELFSSGQVRDPRLGKREHNAMAGGFGIMARRSKSGHRMFS